MKSIKILSPALLYSSRCHCRFLKYYPTLLSVSNFSSEKLEQNEISRRERFQLKKTVIEKWKRPPFVKNFFFGKFDTNLLAFPEILNKEHLSEIEKVVKMLNEIYKEKVSTPVTNEEKKVPNEILQELKDIGIFGRMVPLEYGGSGLTYTECTRLNEVLGLDWSVYTILAAHECSGVQALLSFGNEEQKLRYLPDFASGKSVAAFCFHESQSGCDPNAIETVAVLNECNQSYLLNGTKSWVTNAEIADVFIVFAKTSSNELPDEMELTAFIVEKNADEMEIYPTDKSSLLGTSTCTVKFKEREVPTCNRLGQLGQGPAILLKMYEAARFNMGAFTFGTLKALLDQVTEYLIDTERLEKCLADMQLVRKRLSNVATIIYAMESMAYYTAAIYDSTENPDCVLESTILKIFTSENTTFCLEELLKAVGSLSVLNNQKLETLHRSSRALSLFEGPNDIARLYLGLVGCQVVGSKKAEDIKKFRNPLFFPWDNFKKMIKNYRIQIGKVKFDQDIAGHIHPSLVFEGNELEKCIQQLELCVEYLLSEHGAKVIETQLDPVRLADVTINLYAMAAVLARSSRSYCIGLRNAEHEIRMAAAFCQKMSLENQRLFIEISEGVYKNNDERHLMLGEQIIDWKGYFPEHPLKHNF